jgi:hypothetical protein
MIETEVEGIGKVEIAENPVEAFYSKTLDRLKKDKIDMENNLDFTNEMIKVVELKLKK